MRRRFAVLLTYPSIYLVLLMSAGLFTRVRANSIPAGCSAPATTITTGPPPSGGGVLVRDLDCVLQDAFPSADDVHFTVKSREPNFLQSWSIGLAGYTHSSSSLISPGNIAVSADGVDLPMGTFEPIYIDLTLFKRNSKSVTDFKWTSNGHAPVNGPPDNGWNVGPPRPDPTKPGMFIHQVTISNLDPTRPFFLADLCASASTIFFSSLLTAPCKPLGLPEKRLGPGSSFAFDVETNGTLAGGHIYFGYDLADGASIMEIERADHPITTTPEPSSLFLLGTGLLGLVPVIRRKLRM